VPVSTHPEAGAWTELTSVQHPCCGIKLVPGALCRDFISFSGSDEHQNPQV
jgi:hypothetical protein